MLLRIDHETVLTYTEPVIEHVFELRMAPVSNDEQTSLGYRLNIAPLASSTPYRDGHGNRVELITLLAPCQKIVVRATSYVRTHRKSASERLAGLDAANARHADEFTVAAMDYLGHSSLADEGEWLEKMADRLEESAHAPLEAFLTEMIRLVSSSLRYEKQTTGAGTKASEAVALGTGVCQDFSHIFIALSRKVGLPARYVSGYIHEPGEIATHAWVQVWCGQQAGWIDIDPTHHCFAGDDHVQVAVGCDFSDVPPNRGSWRGLASEDIQVSVRVEQVSRLPADWIDSESLPLKGAKTESGNSPQRGAARPSARQFQRMLYRQQQQQQQQ
jgi:transglutaminase-like putative cysteine protease